MSSPTQYVHESVPAQDGASPYVGSSAYETIHGFQTVGQLPTHDRRLADLAKTREYCGEPQRYPFAEVDRPTRCRFAKEVRRWWIDRGQMSDESLRAIYVRDRCSSSQ